MLGLCSVTFRDKKPEEIIGLVKSAGLEVIEWASDSHVPEDDFLNAEKISKMMDEANLKTSSYGTYYKLGTFSNFENILRVAKIIGASTIRVWAGEESSINTSIEKREKIVEDAKRIGKLAEKEGINIGIEYHLNTLTDSPESAEQLMLEINLKNVLLYWQPAESLSVKERIESIPKLAPWIVNVHVFHWQDYNNRYPLEQGYEEWKQYIERIEKKSLQNINYLLEFVPGEDQVKGFRESSKTLKMLVEEK